MLRPLPAHIHHRGSQIPCLSSPLCVSLTEVSSVSSRGAGGSYPDGMRQSGPKGSLPTNASHGPSLGLRFPPLPSVLRGVDVSSPEHGGVGRIHAHNKMRDTLERGLGGGDTWKGHFRGHPAGEKPRIETCVPATIQSLGHTFNYRSATCNEHPWVIITGSIFNILRGGHGAVHSVLLSGSQALAVFRFQTHCQLLH